MMKNTLLSPLVTSPWADYALLDSGSGRKLERYARVIVDRPEPQALWQKTLPESVWQKADAVFTNAGDDESDAGKWRMKNTSLPDAWHVGWEGLSFQCRLMSFRHMGLFPEQAAHWSWVNDQIESAGRPLKILNLFAYTGAASLAAAKMGAHVTHLDASKKAIQWAKDNQAASRIAPDSIRWICDDASEFVARELRRGSKYDGIILDPPRFGRGPDGQRWQIEEHLSTLMQSCAALLSDNAKFLILTAYALRLSSVTLHHLIRDHMTHGDVQSGELMIAQDGPDRLLSTSLYARWSV
jgi:23S rRNA (cytosine1962-C5)-methyltransferase